MKQELEQNRPKSDSIQRKGAPNIFEYDDFRAFLRDYYDHQKIVNDNFSFRYFSNRLGYSSPSFFKFVMQGERNLTHDGIARFAKALGFSGPETTYFRNLVQFNQATTADDKHLYAQEIARSKIFKEKRPLDQAKFKYWSRWYNVAIRELVAIDGFQEDPHWIANAVVPSITPEQARESLNDLLTLGLIARDASGKLVLSESDLRSGDQLHTASVKEFHREMAARGKESIDRFKADRRHVTSLTFPLSERGEKRIRDMINAFQRELINVAQSDRDCVRVVQVSLQYFPLSREIVKKDPA